MMKNRRAKALIAAVACSWSTLGCSAPVDSIDLAASREDIIGGGPAAAGQWPWMVWFSVEDFDFQCGGTVIDQEWVLTAQHCTRTRLFQNELAASEFTVTAGDFDRGVDEGTEQVSLVDRVERADYGASAFGPADFDVALLHLTTPLTWTPFVQPMRPAVGADGPGLTVVDIGWGGTTQSVSPPPSDQLNQVTTVVVSNESCVIPDSRALQFDEICSGNSSGSVGNCHGDSGSSQMTQRSGGTWEQVGVTSWGAPDCTSFSVDARVSSHVGWIRQFVYDVASLPATNLAVYL